MQEIHTVLSICSYRLKQNVYTVGAKYANTNFLAINIIVIICLQKINTHISINCRGIIFNPSFSQSSNFIFP